MATVTPNYNFPIPQSTDLVKDGATAIAALGTSIDTQFVDLKGGTTGQVLAKASNTDLDYTWVAQDDSNAIQNAIVDAKGDLIAATAADTPARLAVGTDGQVLTASSGAATGLAWATPAAGYADNCYLNSSFQIWQRGTSFTSSGVYSADRWIVGRAGGAVGATYSRQVTGDTTNLPNIQYCMRLQRDSGNTNTANIGVGQVTETINAIPYAGKTVTLSFYARVGANFSATSSVINAYITTGTGTDQNGILGAWTGAATPISQNFTATTTWQRFSVTGTIASTATEFYNYINYTPTGTAGANDYLEVTGVMLEVGSTASAFHTNQPTIQAELAACQRYYWRAGGDSNYQPYGIGSGQTSTTAQFSVQNPVPMRVAPTSIDFSTLAVTDTILAFSVSALGFGNAGKYASTINVTTSSLTLYRPYILVSNNSTSGFFGLSAEL